MSQRILVPIDLPGWIYRPLGKIKRAVVHKREQAIDLSGDREIEYSFVASRIPAGTGTILDFGCGYGTLSMHAVQRGYQVKAVDLEAQRFPWVHPNLDLICGDFLQLQLPPDTFDFIMNCSSIEHVGLKGRYGVAAEETDGDLAAMSKLRLLLKSSGKMLLTIPCGRDAAIAPWHRVYGPDRLPKLLNGYAIEEEAYWVKDSNNRWHIADRAAALRYIPTSHPTIGAHCSYALGCFVLRRAQ